MHLKAEYSFIQWCEATKRKKPKHNRKEMMRPAHLWFQAIPVSIEYLNREMDKSSDADDIMRTGADVNAPWGGSSLMRQTSTKASLSSAAFCCFYCCPNWQHLSWIEEKTGKHSCMQWQGTNNKTFSEVVKTSNFPFSSSEQRCSTVFWSEAAEKQE